MLLLPQSLCDSDNEWKRAGFAGAINRFSKWLGCSAGCVLFINIFIAEFKNTFARIHSRPIYCIHTIKKNNKKEIAKVVYYFILINQDGGSYFRILFNFTHTHRRVGRLEQNRQILCFCFYFQNTSSYRFCLFGCVVFRNIYVLVVVFKLAKMSRSLHHYTRRSVGGLCVFHMLYVRLTQFSIRRRTFCVCGVCARYKCAGVGYMFRICFEFGTFL